MPNKIEDLIMCVFFNENRQKNEDFQVKNTQIKKKKRLKKPKSCSYFQNQQPLNLLAKLTKKSKQVIFCFIPYIQYIFVCLCFNNAAETNYYFSLTTCINHFYLYLPTNSLKISYNYETTTLKFSACFLGDHQFPRNQDIDLHCKI